MLSRFIRGFLVSRLASPVPSSSHYPFPPDFRPPQFFVNGERRELEPVGFPLHQLPFVTFPLSSYLRRDAGLTSVKIGCEEGGCGACVVLVQDVISDSIYSVNSCLFPLAEVVCGSLNVVTLEGLLDSPGMNIITEAFSEYHATQCGFCTPGFEMTLYGALMNRPSPPAATLPGDLVRSLSGNLCRCTGYRSILDAADEASMQFDPATEKELPVWTTNDQLSGVSTSSSLSSVCLGAKDGSVWISPVTLDEVLELKGEENESIAEDGRSNETFGLIRGGSEVMIASNLLCSLCSSPPPSLISTSRIRGEMNEIVVCVDDTDVVSDCPSFIRIGAAVTLSNLESFCQESGAAFSVESAILTQLERFASPSVRNIASVGGNLANASPTSDLNPIWLACGAMVNLEGKGSGRRSVPIADFFVSYKTVAMDPFEVIVSIDVPCGHPNEVVVAYKQSRRREDDIATMTACFRVRFDEDEDRILDSGFGFGCLDETPVLVGSVSDFLLRKQFTEEVFESAVSLLAQEVVLDEDVPGGMAKFRSTLALSFFFKFYLTVLDFLSSDEECEDYRLRSPNSRKAEQKFDLKKKGTAVGLPLDSVFSATQVLGQAKYVDDISPHPDELFAELVISTVAHARLISIDPKAALDVDGVVGWVDHLDIPGENEMGVGEIMDEELIVTEDITSVGQVLGMVLARDRHVARKAAKLVVVKVVELDSPPILTIDEAIEAESFFENFAPEIRKGNPEEALASADQVVSGQLKIGAQDHFYLEPQTCRVVPDEDDLFHITVSSQWLVGVQDRVSSVLGLPVRKILVESRRLGGGFGGKESRPSVYAALAAVAAKKFQVPVRIVLDRHADMRSSGVRHSFQGNFKAGVSHSGRITSLKAELFSNGGYSMDFSSAVVERALVQFDNFYNFDNISVIGRVCRTNRSTGTAMRGFGTPQAILFCEYIMDSVARAVGTDPCSVREQLFYQEGDMTPYGMEVFQCHAERIWNDCREKSDFDDRQIAVQQFNEQNEYRKRGIYIMPVKYGIGFSSRLTSALVHVYKDGSVVISHGGIEMGQGLHTKVAQVAANTLDIPIDYIQIVDTATDKCANTPATASSSGSDLNCMATLLACEEIMERLDSIVTELEYPLKASWEDVTLTAFRRRVHLTGQGHFGLPGVTMDWETGQGRPARYFTWASAVCEVEIDVLTGDHRLLRTDILFDVGDSINPKIDIGQIEGAFVQGYGWVTLEEMVWGDKHHSWFPREGDVQSIGPGFYKIPTTDDIPLEFNVELLSGTANPLAVHSSKGVGEPPFCLAGCVYFALHEAVTAAREASGIENPGEFCLGHPATAERIRMACEDRFSREFAEDFEEVGGSY